MECSAGTSKVRPGSPKNRDTTTQSDKLTSIVRVREHGTEVTQLSKLQWKEKGTFLVKCRVHIGGDRGKKAEANIGSAGLKRCTF